MSVKYERKIHLEKEPLETAACNGKRQVQNSYSVVVWIQQERIRTWGENI